MPFLVGLLADVAPPDGAFELEFLPLCLAVVLLPFLFGALILTVAHIHRKRSQSPENRP